MRDDLNSAISKADIIEMLAQHLITKPVFDALFEGNFTQRNPMSIAMQAVTEQHYSAQYRQGSRYPFVRSTVGEDAGSRH